MILVDTSVWIDHLRKGNAQLVQLLEASSVCIHPMIIGELACGNLHNRKQLLNLWQNLPMITEATHNEVMHLLESQKLMGKGIGYVDLHLLAATKLSGHAQLWTQDKRLKHIAESTDIVFHHHS